MKNITLLLVCLCLMANEAISQVAINTDGSPADSTAMLDIKSSNKGLLIPRMSTALRTSIPTPSDGLMVYDTTTHSTWYSNAGVWQQINNNATLTLPYSAFGDTTLPLFFLSNNGPGSVILAVDTSQAAGVTAVQGIISSQSSGGSSAGVRGINNGSGYSSFGVWGSQNGLGAGVYGTTVGGQGVWGSDFGSSNTGYGVYGNSYNGTGVYASSYSGIGLYATSDESIAGLFSISNTHSNHYVISASTLGYGNVINAVSYGGGNVVVATDSGMDGSTGYFKSIGTTNPSPVLYASGNGDGSALYLVQNNLTTQAPGMMMTYLGLNSAGVFESYSEGTNKATIAAHNYGTGQALLCNQGAGLGDITVFQSEGANVARIDVNGKGYFDGGTQNSGADVAEALNVEGDYNNYEPGDVLEISVTANRTVVKCSSPYSTLVAGVYATKPGLLLTENTLKNPADNKVPMGVIGIIPTKVCNENGPITRGDLLVTSSKAGYAMKASLKRVKPGQVLGKALEPMDAETGKINVLVNVR